MQDEIIYNDLNIQQGEPSSLNKGKKRALEDVEESNLYKSKRRALHNTTQDNIGGVKENSTANFEPIINNIINENNIMDNALNYDSIYRKITNLIELREVEEKDAIRKLIFESKELKYQFYKIIKALNLTNYKNVSLTKINNLLQGLEKFIDVTPTNPNSINRSDILADSLYYESIYDKISNLIKKDSIKPWDRINKLKFEPESLKSEFYAIIRYLKLTNYKVTSSTRIENLQETLEDKTVENYIEDISINGNRIKREDILDEGLDYISIYIKILNLTKDNYIGPNDRLNKLKYEPESLKSEFYARIKDLNLTKYNEVKRTHIENKKLRSEIVKKGI
jgi:hypothetical protein